MRVIATAGHVDHGKSTLVRALTGTDPDRLPEERERGLTIDLGFANAALPSGEEVAFVDVPGHSRYVANMLAGVGAVDACLFVVDASEGWKAQSEEHLRILELLGLRHGLVALTKVGLVDDEWLDLVDAEVRDHLEGTFLSGAEIVRTDVQDRVGVITLRSALDRLVAVVPAAPDQGRPRLWIDRAFTVRGSGTVVTGTLRGGRLEVGLALAVEPGGHPVRVRGLQSHHRSVEAAPPGRRLAVNLSGTARDDLGRGHALVRPGQWHMTTAIDARLEVIATLGHDVERRGAYFLYTGSGEHAVRMRVIGAAGIEAGANGLVRMWLPSGGGLPLLPGDRFVLREAGRYETVGGGEILDVAPVLPTTRAAPDRSVDRVIRERGWVDAGELVRLTGTERPPDIGRWVVDADLLAAATLELTERLTAAGADGVDLASLDERQRALLERVPGVAVTATRAVLGELADDRLSADAQRVLGALEEGGWSPPTFGLEDRGALRELERGHLAVEAGDHWFAATSIHQARSVIRGLLEADPAGFTVAQARDALGTSRRHILPLLGHLDATGNTRRRGDLRTAGPRLSDRT